MNISINSKTGNAYAVKELKLFLNTYTNSQILTDAPDAQKCVTLELDSSLPARSLKISSRPSMMTRITAWFFVQRVSLSALAENGFTSITYPARQISA